MRKYWKEILIIIVFVIIIVPLIIALMMNIKLICTDTSNEWIGFWGGYLGAIISAGIAIYVMRKTIKNEKDIRDLDEKSKFLNDLIEKRALITKCNKYLLSEVEFTDDEKTISIQKDKKTFLKLCADLNQQLDEFELFLLIGDYTDKYRDIGRVKKALEDYSSICAEMIEILRQEKAEDDIKKKIFNLLKKMPIIENKFNNSVKEFIKANTVKDI